MTAYHHIKISPRGTRNTLKPVSRLSEQTGLPSHQTGLQADLPGLGFDLHPNPSPSPKKPVGAGASPFGKPKSELSKRNWTMGRSAKAKKETEQVLAFLQEFKERGIEVGVD
ncbi:hypothetical protein C8R45DRAFT_940926 [Mycena sanguinolenta]|nr:hypothetical protein C8R45DRAFT_940926 [Mycena sanguinolenta]